MNRFALIPPLRSPALAPVGMTQKVRFPKTAHTLRSAVTFIQAGINKGLSSVLFLESKKHDSREKDPAPWLIR